MNTNRLVLFTKNNLRTKPAKIFVYVKAPKEETIAVCAIKEPIVANTTQHRFDSHIIKDALDNLIVALKCEHREEHFPRKQKKAQQLARRALALNHEFSQEHEAYSWFNFYTEQTLANDIALYLLNLKSLMPAKWSLSMRSEVHALAFSYSHYFDTRKKLLEKESVTT